MVTIRFIASGVEKTVREETSAGQRRTLLQIAKEHRVPILFNCETGCCGACMVLVVDESAAATGLAAPGEMEQLFLDARGKHAADDAPTTPRYRLACVAHVGEGDLVVRFSNSVDLG